MGVLNITPDSFSDGGLFFEEKKAIKSSKVDDLIMEQKLLMLVESQLDQVQKL